MKIYSLRVLIGLDQLINTVLGGYPNETLSARAWRRGALEGDAAWKLFQEVVDAMFIPLHFDHCQGSYEHILAPTNSLGIYHPVPYSPIGKLPIDLPTEWPISDE